MKHNTQQYFIIDFDSTFIRHEGLELLAEIALKSHPQKASILKQIATITDKGMDGSLPFVQSLTQRLALLEAKKSHIEQLVKKLTKIVTPSIKRNKAFFKAYKDRIYIISGGFTEFITPLAAHFGIDPDHVIANTFVFDKQGNITGFDTTNILAQENGKAKAVKKLQLQGEIIVIGDGITDFQIKQEGIATTFVAFTENIAREAIVKHADHIAPTFDEFLYVNNLPMTVSYPKNRIRVLLLENIDQLAVSNFEKEGYSVTAQEKSLSEAELIKAMKDVHVLGIRSRTHITEAVLAASPRLLTIGAFCIGTDQIKLHHAAERGISVFNAPYSNTRSVVELAIGEIIMLMRGIPERNRQLHLGIWDKSAKHSHEIRGKTLGIIGYGNIGSQLSVAAEALGMRVVFYDSVEKLALGNAIRVGSMQELCKLADVITIHVDGRKENTNLIDEKVFRQMKDGVIFLNLARGKIVDLQALHTAVTTGKVRGAAVDVFPKEPKGKDEPFVSALQNLPNVILTPHIGGSTQEAQKNIAQFVSHKIIDYINTGNTYLSVNFPNVQLPPMHNVHRLLHIHNNVPGILANINRVLAEHNSNIESQHLKTTEQIGYVITDVNKKYDTSVFQQLKKIPDTIRFRVLY
jgi:D-3-phosphoglycerate dehydrogenase / 2-oxoglutarate reductase